MILCGLTFHHRARINEDYIYPFVKLLLKNVKSIFTLKRQKWDLNHNSLFLSCKIVSYSELFRRDRMRTPDKMEFHCRICMEDVPEAMEAKLKSCPDSECTRRVCRTCMEEFIKNWANSNRLKPILCPAGCMNNLDGLECADFLDSCEAGSGEQLRMQQLLQSMSNLKYCANPHCNTPFEFLGGSGPDYSKVLCPLCKVESCVSCNTVYHTGITCEEVAKHEPLGELKEKEKLKACPKCGHLIDRSGGCHLIMCVCGNPFCYLCGLNYTDCECSYI